MNLESNIKIVRRIGIPETNSSSSHAVTISMKPTNLVSPGDEDWDIDITDDGILKIPGGESFGWEYFKTNSLLTKLQYLCGIYCYDIRTISGKKSITKLKKILKEIFGVRDVEFLWITEFSKRLKEEEDPDDVYYSYPEIDHNSHDIFEEITENINVIRAFLLSRDSWLYGGNDNSDPPEGFYNEPTSVTRVNAILSIELGGNIGRVDWEIKNFIDRVGQDVISRTLGKDDEFQILGELDYDIVNKKWNLEDKEMEKLMEGNFLLYFDYSLYQKESGEYYVLYTNDKFNRRWIENKKEKYGDVYSSKMISGKVSITEKTIKEMKEGVDYVLFPVKIKLLEYGDYEI